MKETPQVVVWPRRQLRMVYGLLVGCLVGYGFWLLAPLGQPTFDQWLTRPRWPSGLLWLVLGGFVHVHWLALVLNGYSLYMVAREAERFLGPGRVGVVFCLSSWAGGVTHLSLTAQGTLGAAGGVFGLLGALGIFIYRQRWLFADKGRGQLQRMVVILALNFILLAWLGGHTWVLLGGLGMGCFLGWLLGPVWRLSPHPQTAPPPKPSTLPSAPKYWQAVDIQPFNRSRWLEVLACTLGLLVLANAALMAV